VTASALETAKPARRRRPWSATLPTLPAILMVIPLVVVALLFIVYPLVKLAADALTQGDGGFSNFLAVFESRAQSSTRCSTPWSCRSW